MSRKTSLYARKRAHGLHPLRHANATKLLPLQRFSQRDETDLQLLPHVALERFRVGDGTVGNWNTLSFRLNWARVLVRDVFAENLDAADTIVAGLDSLAEIELRWHRTGKWGVAGVEFQRLGAALNLMDDMQTQCTRIELRNAVNTLLVENRHAMKAGTLQTFGLTADVSGAMA